MKYMREIDDNVMIQYIILFTLAKVNRHVTYKQITGLILDNCNIEFSNFQLALTNLVETEHVRSFSPDEFTTVYELLPKGVEADGFFEKNIPIYIRDQIEEAIPPFFNEEEEKRSVRSELVPVTRNEYAIKCGIYDRSVPLLEMTVYAGSRKDANKMLKYFNENTEMIYKDIIDKVTDGGKVFSED